MISPKPFEFSDRHIGPRLDDISVMLEAIGVESIDDLIAETVPSSIRMRESLDLPAALSEPGALSSLQEDGIEEPGDHLPDRTGVLQRPCPLGDSPDRA